MKTASLSVDKMRRELLKEIKLSKLVRDDEVKESLGFNKTYRSIKLNRILDYTRNEAAKKLLNSHNLIKLSYGTKLFVPINTAASSGLNQNSTQK